ncbi:hypothetical protein DTW91_09790 [Chryseobacterium sp. SC28]|nr:hypothetical protein DTW91_09790 [Chryseobacterium sp. SC28]
MVCAGQSFSMVLFIRSMSSSSSAKRSAKICDFEN